MVNTISIMETEKATQKKRIAFALQRGETITPMVAFKEFECLNLSARIHELEQDGMSIKREWVKVPSGKRVMSYRQG